MRRSTFWIETLERAAKTASQAAVAAFVLTDPNSVGFDALATDWSAVGSFALGGAVLSVLTSIISAPIGKDGSPSLVHIADSTD